MAIWSAQLVSYHRAQALKTQKAEDWEVEKSLPCWFFTKRSSRKLCLRTSVWGSPFQGLPVGSAKVYQSAHGLKIPETKGREPPHALSSSPEFRGWNMRDLQTQSHIQGTRVVRTSLEHLMWSTWEVPDSANPLGSPVGSFQRASLALLWKTILLTMTTSLLFPVPSSGS